MHAALPCDRLCLMLYSLIVADDVRVKSLVSSATSNSVASRRFFKIDV